MNRFKYILVTILLFVGITTQGQEVQFTFQLGAAIPVGDFAVNDATPDSGGFASTGFDMHFIGIRKFSNNFIAGVNIGYSVFGMDQEAVKKAINPTDPSLVNVETQSFQNISLQGRVGYDIEVIEERLHVVPYVDGGLGVFNSAYYAIQDGNGNILFREGNSAMAFLLTPGLDILVKLNTNLSVKVYGGYQFANYSVDEKFTVTGNFDAVKYNTVNYKYNSINAGLGLVFTLGI